MCKQCRINLGQASVARELGSARNASAFLVFSKKKKKNKTKTENEREKKIIIISSDETTGAHSSSGAAVADTRIRIPYQNYLGNILGRSRAYFSNSFTIVVGFFVLSLSSRPQHTPANASRVDNRAEFRGLSP